MRVLPKPVSSCVPHWQHKGDHCLQAVGVFIPKGTKALAVTIFRKETTLHAYVFMSNIRETSWPVADLRGRQGRAPPWVQILLFSCSFRENFGQIIGFHPILEVGTLLSWKSWIRHCWHPFSKQKTSISWTMTVWLVHFMQFFGKNWQKWQYQKSRNSWIQYLHWQTYTRFLHNCRY